ncbi:hypothetical protein J6590_038494 [Homalodisca vitripennis]|nr:hypothetical protein J6590_038494 [Homalodisca vitripennis]
MLGLVLFSACWFSWRRLSCGFVVHKKRRLRFKGGQRSGQRLRHFTWNVTSRHVAVGGVTIKEHAQDRWQREEHVCMCTCVMIPTSVRSGNFISGIGLIVDSPPPPYFLWLQPCKKLLR